MVIDFSKIDLKKRPTFILRNLDGTAIAALNNILNPQGKFCYDEISEITFEYPSQINGQKLAEYDLLTAMRVIDLQGIGQFTLRNPVETDNGIVKKKECSAYSLEYELTNKKIYLEEGTYEFWNPLTPDGTILGIILSEVKSWNRGTVSSDLIGKYRTFSVDNMNVYDWIKSDLQNAFSCIFEFDTYSRTINVRSVNDVVNTKPVYLSTKNLAKEIEIEENTDNLVTALEVYGADGVDIRSVNPMGTNCIYNLDAYMDDKYFSSEMVTQWNKWKDTFESYQQTYYQLTVAQNMQISRLTTEEGVLADLDGELSGLESKRAVIIQAIAIDQAQQADLVKVNAEIAQKNKDIKKEKALITEIQGEIDSITAQLKEINTNTSFDAFFDEKQLIVLDRYFKCESLTDTTFVATSVDSYAVDADITQGLSAIFNITGIGTLQITPYGDDMTFYIIRGGVIETSDQDVTLSAKIINGTLQVNSDLSFVFSVYLSSGTLNENEFPGGTIAMTGNLGSDVVVTDTTLQFKTNAAAFYVTQDVTEYQRMSVCWELFEYGKEYLKKLSSPTYYFSVSSINFFDLDEFLMFAKEFVLGERIYIDTSMGILTPIAVAVEVDFDDPTELTLDFGNSFSLNDSSFKLEELLSNSVSMGNTLDTNQYNYSSFVNSGAKTQVKDFMSSAIDTMKNRILSGSNEEIVIDQAGIKCRSYDEESRDYSPKQIWISHNALMFTADNWNSAAIGIGEFVDKNFESTLFGVIAPAIVGTILAGSQLIIESEKQDGGVAVFRVGPEGASLHNASFNLYGETGGRIDMGAIFGIVAGADRNEMFYYDDNGNPIGVKTANDESITSLEDLASGDTPNVNFWLDMNGNAYFKGDITATTGFIGGWEIGESYLYSGSGTTRVALNGGTSLYSEYAIWAGGESPSSANFWVKKNGEMKATNGTFSGTLDAAYVSGVLSASEKGGSIEGCSIDVNNGVFNVDSNGNVTINGNLTLKNGSITWASLNKDTTNKINDAYITAGLASSEAYEAKTIAEQIAEGEYSGGTFIDGQTIYSPTIYADEFNVYPRTKTSMAGGYSLYSYFGDIQYRMLHIYYGSDGIGPCVYFDSDSYANARWNFGKTSFLGSIDFSGATVTGLNISSTATFG